MNLIIDIGNTRTKLSVFDRHKLIHYKAKGLIDKDVIEELFVSFPALKNVIVSSVGKEPESLLNMLTGYFEYCCFLAFDTPLPIKNCYATPKTLGLDRLAAAVGAWGRAPDENLLVVDMGTAITIDFVNAQGEYLGGNISPGMNTRFRALNTFTEKLPLLEAKDEDVLLGNNTESAIRLGVQNGVNYELSGYISSFESNYKSLTVFLTGGEAFFFAKKFKRTIFAPDLLAEGLDCILNFNLADFK